MNLYNNEYPAVYRGIVEDNDDSKNLGRCKVRVPSIHGGEGVDLPWARPLVLSPVNSERGSVNIPDVGDIVWVMFEASNKRYPVYFGGIYAESDIPVDIKSVDIYVDKENKITYNRNEGEESYTINLGENQIKISESGIEIIGDTSIQGNLSVEGDISTTGNVSIDGELTVSGNASITGDLSVGGSIYTNSIFEGNPLYGDISTPGLSEEEMDAILGELGLDGNQDYLSLAEKYLAMGLNEGDGSADFIAKAIFGANYPDGTPTTSSNTPWCASFVSYCLKKAGISGYCSAGVSGLMNQAKNLGTYRSSSSYTPKAGDVFILKDSRGSHTGFVASVNSDGTFITVEGNSGNKVSSHKKSLSDVTGFIQMS